MCGGVIMHVVDAHPHGVHDVLAGPNPEQGSSRSVHDCPEHALLDQQCQLACLGLLALPQDCLQSRLDKEMVHCHGKEAAKATVPSQHKGLL